MELFLRRRGSGTLVSPAGVIYPLILFRSLKKWQYLQPGSVCESLHSDQKWLDADKDEFPISVNLSRVHFKI